MMLLSRFALALPILAPAAPSPAQTEPEPAPVVERETQDLPAEAAAADRLDVELLGGAWIPRLNGLSRLGPAGSISLESDLELDQEREFAWTAELTIRVDERWQVRAIVTDFSTEGSGIAETFAGFGDVVLTPGDPYEASVDFESYAGELGVDLVRPYPVTRDRPWPRPEPESRGDTALRFTALVGARYLDVSQSVEAVGVARDSASGEWLAVYGGLEMQIDHHPPGGLPLGKGVSLRAGAATGYDVAADGGRIWDVRASVRYFLTSNASLMVGYRLIDLDTEDADFTFDAGLRGLLFGGSIAF